LTARKVAKSFTTTSSKEVVEGETLPKKKHAHEGEKNLVQWWNEEYALSREKSRERKLKIGSQRAPGTLTGLLNRNRGGVDITLRTGMIPQEKGRETTRWSRRFAATMV